MIAKYVEYKPKKYMENQEQKLSSKKYLDYIRNKPCLVCGSIPCDPDHLEARGMGGAGKGGTVTNTLKDFSCIPLCRNHHTERGSLGNEKFENKYTTNVWRDAFRLLRSYFAE